MEKSLPAHTAVMYYNYHGVAKKLIREGHLIGYEVASEKDGKRRLLLIFDSHPPMPIREERIIEYAELLSSHLVRRGDPQQGE